MITVVNTNIAEKTVTLWEQYEMWLIANPDKSAGLDRSPSLAGNPTPTSIGFINWLRNMYIPNNDKRPTLYQSWMKHQLPKVGLLVLTVASIAALALLLMHRQNKTPVAAPKVQSSQSTVASVVNCTQLKAVGRHNIPVGDSAYRLALDRDRDGSACEK